MVKLHKREDLDAGQSDLANFLIELSEEGAKIPHSQRNTKIV